MPRARRAPSSHTAAVLIVCCGRSILMLSHSSERMIHRTLALLILLLGLANPAMAGDLDEAVTAARGGDYATALRRLSPLAAKGDARAEFDVGFMHAYGWGVARNPAEAMAWYRKAAEQGLAVAQHFLGLAYFNGEGVRPDGVEAARWFARAAGRTFDF